jgi:hypothetical protein
MDFGSVAAVTKRVTKNRKSPYNKDCSCYPSKAAWGVTGNILYTHFTIVNCGYNMYARF